MAASTKVTNIEIPVMKLILDVDPDWFASRRRELAYDFPRPGRFFYEDPEKSGAYGRPSRLLTESGERVVLEVGGGSVLLEQG